MLLLFRLSQRQSVSKNQELIIMNRADDRPELAQGRLLHNRGTNQNASARESEQ